LGNPDQSIGIKTKKSKADTAGTVGQGTNQLKIPLNLGNRNPSSGINIG
jgi:hypothetical protein